MKKFLKEIFVKIKSLDKAVNSYKTQTKSIVMPSKAYLNWGINLALSGKINDAIEKFEMSSNMSFSDPESYMNWGIALAKLHRFEEAIEKFDEALKIDKTYSSAYSLKGAALVELNRTDEAIECYNTAIKYAPFDSEIYINWGVALARINQKAKAEEQFKKALGLSLHNANAAFLLGVVSYEQNKLTEAIEAFKYTIGIEPNHAMAFYYMSLSHTKLEHYDEALEAALIALQLLPFKVDFMVNLAECYYDKQDIKSTIKTYRSIELIAPEAFAFLISAGIFWQKVKKYKRSFSYLEKAITKPEADYLTKYYYAISCAGLDRFDEAKEVFIGIMQENPEFYDAAIKLAILHKKNAEYDAAIEILENVFAKSLKFTQFYELLADCYKLKGNTDKAIEYYRKTLDYYPENVPAHVELAHTLFTQVKDIKNAIRMIRVAYKLKKDDVKINTLFALILAEDNDFDGAMEKINYAISLDENNIETYLKKARILNHFSQQEKYSELVNLIKEKFSTQEDYINSQLAE